MRAIFSATRSLAFIVLAATLASGASSAQEAHRTARMSFKDGRASVSGQIRGYDFVDYVFSAGASESIEVEMKTANTATYFNLLAPGDKETSFFTGSTSGMRFAGPAPASGDYTARVYMMRSAARRGERAAYRLTVVLGGKSATNEKGPDFADGLTGGPDFWEVAGVAAGDALNLRDARSSQAKVVARFGNGAALRNHGCKNVQGQRWCRVEAAGNARQAGWANGHYLRESAGPSGDPAATACLAALNKLAKRADSSVVSISSAKTGTTVTMNLPGAEKPWRCRYQRGKIVELTYLGEG